MYPQIKVFFSFKNKSFVKMKDLTLIIFKAGLKGFIVFIFGSAYFLYGSFFGYVKLRVLL